MLKVYLAGEIHTNWPCNYYIRSFFWAYRK